MGSSMMLMLIISVSVAVMVLIFTSVLGGSTFELVEDDISGIADDVVTAESFASSNVTAAQLNNGYIQTGTLSIYNASGSIGLANFTIDYTLGTILSNDVYTGFTLLANYTHGQAEVRTSIQEGIIGGFRSMEEAGQYLPIIVIGVIMVILFTLLFAGMLGKKMGGSAL